MSTPEVEQTEITLETLLAPANVNSAWAAVKRNDGAPGVDRKTIQDTLTHLKHYWPGIRDKLLSGDYRPAAVRAVEIPKASGGTRLLGIPTVQDRLLQQAINQRLSELFDPLMSDNSFGFRPNRSAQDAVTRARSYVDQGKIWVVDIDLKSFFDQVNHDQLMRLISPKVSDKRVLKLIGRYLRARLRHADGRQEKRLRGTPLGFGSCVALPPASMQSKAAP